MPYACHKCGSTIEDGTPFCPQCGAPQIRVQVPEAAQPQPAPSPAVEPQDPRAFVPGTPAEMQPPAVPIPLGALSQPRVNWRLSALPIVAGAAIILVGVILGSLTQLGVLWNAIVIGVGGSVAVALVRRRLGSLANVPARVGAKIGGAAGVLSFSIPAVMALLAFAIDGPAVHEEFVQYIKTVASQMADARSRDSLQNVLQAINTPEGFATFITLSIVLSFVFFFAMGAAGGAIGASLMQRDRSGR